MDSKVVLCYYLLQMVLSDRDIKKALHEKRIIIDPKPNLEEQLGSCSIDLRLGNIFKIFEHSKFPFVDVRESEAALLITKEVRVDDGDSIILKPQDFVLAVTKEHLSLPDDLLARLEGKSSLGRLGIVVHSTASIFDPGWRGVVVLELGNLGKIPVKLRPGMKICALTFETLSSKAETPYYKKKKAKYLNQRTP